MIQETSLISFFSLKETKINHMYYSILSLLKVYNGLTDNEICGFFSEKGLRMKPRTRRNELVKKGLVYKNGKRMDIITKRVCSVWFARKYAV